MKEKDYKNEKTLFSEKIKKFNEEHIRSKDFFRRGGYAVSITAIVLVVIFLLNFFVGKLSNKVSLEFDMSNNNANSITEENKKYLKSIEDNVTVTVCCKKSDYTNYLLSYSQQLYSVNGDEKYFNQTVTFLDLYSLINNKIKINFVDVQSAEYTAIAQEYASFDLAVGDFLVTCEKNGNKRVKHLGFKNIYNLEDPSGYAAYGYDYYLITGNNIENALTGAISYVTTSEIHKAALLKGHSSKDYTSAYKTLLEANNYEVDIIADTFFSKIPEEYDFIAIMAPSNDFLPAEIDALSEFVYNNGKGGKSIVYFADATNPTLPNLNNFLLDWGIVSEEGILFETNEGTLPLKEKRTALFSVPGGDVDFTKDMNGFITGYNVPLKVDEDASEDLTLVKVASTTSTVAIAPIGAPDDWADWTDDDLSSYNTVIESKMKIGDENSYVFAFSSIEFISSDWAEDNSISNKKLVVAVSDISSGNVANGFSFVPKSTGSLSFSGDISQKDSLRIKRIFAIIIPIIVVLSGIFVFIRRRNSR